MPAHTRCVTRRATAAAVLAAGLLAAVPAPAITVFGDRADWLAALGGTAGFTEDFQGFAQDTAFGGAPLATTFFTLSATNPFSPGSVFIDALPLAGVPGVDFSTSNLVGFVDEDASRSFQMQFASGLVAWGTDFSGADSGEGLLITLGGAAFSGLGFLPAGDDGFFGFVLDAGESLVTRVVFSSADRRPDNDPGRGETFALDNVAGTFAAPPVTVPEPAPLLLLLAAAALLPVRRAAVTRPR